MKFQAFGVGFDLVSMDGAIDKILDWISEEARQCRYVVTPNVDHIVVLRSNDAFRTAYQTSDLCVVDGWPVARAISWLSGSRTIAVPGSDLVPAIFSRLNSCGRTSKVFLLGAQQGVAEIAASSIERKWHEIVVVGTYSPPFGFEHDVLECGRICALIRDAEPDIVVVGVGAPKQELWVYHHRDQIGPCVAICAGATIDFLAGAKKRAPRYIRKLRLEWAYRVVQEPRRLFGRYARGAFLFPLYVLQEMFFTRRKRWSNRPRKRM